MLATLLVQAFAATGQQPTSAAVVSSADMLPIPGANQNESDESP